MPIKAATQRNGPTFHHMDTDPPENAPNAAQQEVPADPPPSVRRRKLIPESFIAAPLLFLAVYLSIGGLVKFGVVSSLGWGIVYLTGFAWFIFTPRRTVEVFGRYWPLLLLPGIALLSAIWSEDIAKTLRTGIQFSFSTLLALRIATVLSPASAIGCIFSATLLGLCLSVLALVAPPLQPAFESGNDAFIGIYVQKTVAGLALTLFVLALCAKGAMGNYRILSMLLALCVLPLLVMTKSVSAMVLLGCLTVILLQGMLKGRNATARFAILSLTVVFVATSLSLIWIDSFNFTAFLLEMVGKNATLTGRTDIWILGIEVTEDYPLLGVGYAAFWGNPVFAEEWGFIHATVDPRLKGFHNLYIEALATTGVVGLVLVVGIYYWTMFRALTWFVASGTGEAAFWLALMMAALLISFVDNVLYAEHEFFHMAATVTFVLVSRYAPPLNWRLYGNRRSIQEV